MRRLAQRTIPFILAATLLVCCSLLTTRPSTEPPYPTSTRAPGIQPTGGVVQPTGAIIIVPTALPTAQVIISTPQLLDPPLVELPLGNLVFAALGKGMLQLDVSTQDYQRMLDLPAGATHPFFSPGGSRLGFIFSQILPDGVAHLLGVQEGRQVYRPSGKSPARSLSPHPLHIAWSPDGEMAVLVNALGVTGPTASYYVQVSRFEPQSPPVYWQAWSDFQVKGLESIAWSPGSRALVLIASGETGQRFFSAHLPQPLELGEVQPLLEILPQDTALSMQILPGGRMLYATDSGIYLQTGASGPLRLVTRTLAPYTMVSFNATGRWAALYTRDGGGPFILDLVTGDERQLANADIRSSSHILLWSPDGSNLAFTLADELSPSEDDLYTVSPGGEVIFLRTLSRLSLADSQDPLLAWHPTQPYLLFSERLGDGYLAWTAAADGSGFAYLNPGALASDPSFAWMLDVSVQEVVDIPLAPEPCLAPSPRLKVGNSAYSSLEPAFVSLLYRDASLDSTILGSLNPGEHAWVLSGPICLNNINFWQLRSKVTGLTGWAVEGDSASYFLTPRADALLFTRAKRIYALPLDTLQPRLQADPESLSPGAGMQFTSPQWRPDGQRFSYLAVAPKMSAGLYVQNFQDGSLMDMLATLNFPLHDLPAAAWSPDGSRLVVALGPEDGNRDLYLLYADGSLVQNLTGSFGADDRSPAWSPDGTRILYLSGKGDQTELYILVPGESITRLTSNQVEEISPAWSPLGTRIAYAEKQDGIPELYTIASNGSDRVRISTIPGWYPAWSPDSQRIAFTDPVSDRLILTSAEGSNVRVLALAGRPDSPVQVIWDPSGSRLAYVYQDTLFLYDLTTDSTLALASSLDSPWISWQP